MNQQSLASLIPDPQLLIALPTEQVAKQVLKVCASKRQGQLFQLASVAGRDALFDSSFSHGTATYPRSLEPQIELAAAEAFQWLENNLLIIPAPNPNNTFHRLSRLGEKLSNDDTAFDKFLDLRDFPKSMLHPSIREDVWLQLAQGNLDVAVFKSFRAVEEQVRKVGGFGPNDIGVPLMRNAFHKSNGPLADLTLPEAEREALSSLFAGAIGSYKNPHSHRSVESLEIKEVREMVVLASHLLRIVESRVSS